MLAFTGSLMITSCKKDEKIAPQVISSTATASSGNWGYDAPTSTYFVDISVPGLTAEIAQVMVYIQSGSSYIALPWTVYLSGYSESWNFSYTTGNVRVTVQDSDLATLNPGSVTFKIVCVESYTKALHPDVDWNNYQEVKRKFNLPD